MSEVVNTVTISSLTSYAGACTTEMVKGLNSALKGADLVDAASASVKAEGRGPVGLVGSLAVVYGQICQAVIYGNTTGLKGLVTAQKKTGPLFAQLVGMGVCTPSGALLLGVDEGMKGVSRKESGAAYESLIGERFSWVARMWFEREQARKLARNAASEKNPAAPETAAPETAAPETAAPETEALTAGQQADQAVTLILSQFAAGTLSTENTEALLKALAPYGVKPAPKPKAVKA